MSKANNVEWWLATDAIQKRIPGQVGLYSVQAPVLFDRAQWMPAKGNWESPYVVVTVAVFAKRFPDIPIPKPGERIPINVWLGTGLHPGTVEACWANWEAIADSIKAGADPHAILGAQVLHLRNLAKGDSDAPAD